MMEREFAAILSRYGRKVTLYTQDEPQGTEVRAFFQPVRDRGTAQAVPTPLGQVYQDRFLYLGPAQWALDANDCRVEVAGEIYRAKAVQPIYVGGQLSHWWAVFTRRVQEVAG